MTNQFDQIATCEPDEFVKGDFVQWKRADLAAIYDPALFDLTYEARVHVDGANQIQVAAGETNGEFVISLSSTTTGAYAVGRYEWQLFVTRTSDSQRIKLESGMLEVLADLTNTAADPRSHAHKMLDAIEALLENRSAADVANYSIGGRSLTKLGVDELTLWRGRYRAEVASEERGKKQKRGRGASNQVRVRF